MSHALRTSQKNRPPPKTRDVTAQWVDSGYRQAGEQWWMTHGRTKVCDLCVVTFCTRSGYDGH